MAPALLLWLSAAAAAPTQDLLVSLRQPAGSPHQLARWTADIAAEQAAALACIRPAGARAAMLRTYRATPILFLRMDAAAAARARECPGVEAVSPNRHFAPTLAESVPLIGADTVHADLGWDGTGTAVAIIDTGITYTQSEVGGCFGAGCKVVYGYDFADGDADPTDCHGHGTNVAAIAAGTAGVAPGANIVAYKVFSGSGCSDSTDDAIAAALDDVVLQAATYNIVSVNMSLGTSDYRTSVECDGTGTATETAMTSVYAADVLLVVSAGNDGDEDNVSFPACLRRALAVANTYDADTSAQSWCLGESCASYCTDSAPKVDTLNCSSNGGAMIDVAAPGTTIVAGGQTMSGTSQAAPHVAGAAALLAQAMPGTTPKKLGEWLARSATTVNDTRGTTAYSYPRLDLVTAFAGDLADLKITNLDLETTGGLYAGTAATMAVTVENKGPGTFEDAVVILSTEDPDLGVDGTAFPLGTIDPGVEATIPGVPFDVSAACAEDHNATITVTISLNGDAGDDADATFSLNCFVDDDGDGVDRRDDCDDTDDAVFPDAEETCNGVDDDCDGEIDGANATDPAPWYADADGDGFGDAAVSTSACVAPEGYVADATDCDDQAVAVFPGAPEACVNVDLDADCDGLPGFSDPDATDTLTRYTDADGDGHGAGAAVLTCDDSREDLTATADDCDDADPDVYPSAPGYDANCTPTGGEAPTGCGCETGGEPLAAGLGGLLGLATLLGRRRR